MLEVLNEPAGYLNQNLLDTYRQFGYDAYGAVRYPYGNGDKSGLVVVLHDAFQSPSYFNGYMSSPTYEDVFLDHHDYTIFDNDQVAMTEQQRFDVRILSYSLYSLPSSPASYANKGSFFSTDLSHRPSVAKPAPLPARPSGSWSVNGRSPLQTAPNRSTDEVLDHDTMDHTLAPPTSAIVRTKQATGQTSPSAYCFRSHYHVPLHLPRRQVPEIWSPVQVC